MILIDANFNFQNVARGVNVPTPVNPGDMVPKSYVDNAVIGLLDLRGDFSAALNNFPTTGGSGTAGAVLKGDTWRISTAGTLGTTQVNVGDELLALVDAPGQNDTNWAIFESNRDQATETVKGVVQLATPAQVTAGTDTTTVITPATLQQKVNAITANRFDTTIGDGATTVFTITHNLNSTDVIPFIREVTSGTQRTPAYSNFTANSFTITFQIPPATNQVRVNVRR